MTPVLKRTNEYPIDAVITWVDGQDSEHQAKRQHYLAERGQTLEAMMPTRYNQVGEIRYCLLSLLKFAPWLRHIYIVTDHQFPDVLQELPPQDAEKISCIDHTLIFRDNEHCLPTFNSLSIESMLWRIPNLSEYFIYFNDDCSLIKPVKPSDFFQEHRIVLSGLWKRCFHEHWHRKLQHYLYNQWDLPCEPASPSDHRIFQENAARLAGFQKKFFHLPHKPYPLKKTTFERYNAQHPQHLLQNSQYKFRNLQQFWPISLAYHLDIKAGQIVFQKKFQEVTLHAYHHSWKKIYQRLALADSNPHAKSICIQSLDEADDIRREYLLNWLERRLGSLDAI